MFLLDTNVVSELRPGKPRQSDTVRTWADRMNREQFRLSAVSVFELELGVQRLERKDAAQGLILRLWLQAPLQEFDAQILPYSTTTAILCAALHVPDPRPDRDAMIAATALEHGLTLVTRNTRDFEECGVALLNPWLER